MSAKPLSGFFMPRGCQKSHGWNGVALRLGSRLMFAVSAMSCATGPQCNASLASAAVCSCRQVRLVESRPVMPSRR